MVLAKGKVGQTFRVNDVEGKQKTKDFLFSLGCYKGENITIISKLAGNYVVNLKDSRYAIDAKLAKTIEVEPCDLKELSPINANACMA